MGWLEGGSIGQVENSFDCFAIDHSDKMPCV